MERFNDEDSSNLRRVKELMLKKALEGDTAAAAVFVNALHAETERERAWEQLTAPAEREEQRERWLDRITPKELINNDPSAANRGVV